MNNERHEEAANKSARMADILNRLVSDIRSWLLTLEKPFEVKNADIQRFVSEQLENMPADEMLLVSSFAVMRIIQMGPDRTFEDGVSTSSFNEN